MSGCKGDTISIFVIEGWSMNEYIIYAIVLYTKNETSMKIYCIYIYGERAIILRHFHEKK